MQRLLGHVVLVKKLLGHLQEVARECLDPLHEFGDLLLLGGVLGDLDGRRFALVTHWQEPVELADDALVELAVLEADGGIKNAETLFCGAAHGTSSLWGIRSSTSRGMEIKVISRSFTFMTPST